MRNIIRITNFKQACAYVDNGVQPIKLVYDKKKKRMIFLFVEEDTKNVWKKWKNHLIII